MKNIFIIKSKEKQLMENSRNGQPEYRSSFYVDISNGEFLIGSIAAETHRLFREAQGQNTEISELSDFLISPQKSPFELSNGTLTDFNKEEAIVRGRWLLELIQKKYPEKSLTVLANDKAASIGINYSSKRIRNAKNFGTFGNYQEQIGSENHRRQNAFRHLKLKGLINLVQNIAEETGAVPTIQTFAELSQKRRDIPHPGVIRRIIKPLTFEDLYELAGHGKRTRSWTPVRYKNWGIAYMWANQGYVPSTEVLYDVPQTPALRSKSEGIRNAFGSIVEYQDILLDRFNRQFDKYLRATEKGLYEGEISPRIFRGIHDEWDIVKRFLAHQLMSEFLAGKTSNFHIIESSVLVGEEFEGDFRSRYPNIDIDDLKIFSRQRNLYPLFWPKESGLRYSNAAGIKIRNFTQISIGSRQDILVRIYQAINHYF